MMGKISLGEEELANHSNRIPRFPLDNSILTHPTDIKLNHESDFTRIK